jgi:tetratricopeptide (TPR) repeat protein
VVEDQREVLAAVPWTREENVIRTTLALMLAVQGWVVNGDLARNRLALSVAGIVRPSAQPGLCRGLSTAGTVNGPHSVGTSYELGAEEETRTSLMRGLLLLAQDKPSQAIERFRRAAMTKREPDALLAHFWMGCAAYRLGDERIAIGEWRSAAALNYFLTNGDALRAKGQYAAAVEFYAVATRLDPVSAQAWLGLAGAQQNLATVGKTAWADMLRSAERVLVVAPLDPQAHYLVGYGLFLSGGDASRAEAELRWALGRRVYWADSYMLGSMLLDRGVSGEPVVLMRRALSLSGENNQIRVQLVRAYLAEGQCEQARLTYKEALQVNPEDRGQLESICRTYSVCNCQ